MFCLKMLQFVQLYYHKVLEETIENFDEIYDEVDDFER